MSASKDRPIDVSFAILMGIFVTFVVLTNTVGAKLFVMFGQTLPVSIAWFPLTFLVTDVVSEVYGERRAGLLVVMGFGMSLVMLVAVIIGLSLPASPIYGLGEQYDMVFAPTWRLLFASMCAYLLAQFTDVRLFHVIKRLTGGRYLWLRNNLSTAISQLIDSFTVNVIYLYKNPEVFTGDFMDIMGLVMGLYVIKVVIAFLDTPFCYLGVWLLRRDDKAAATAS